MFLEQEWDKEVESRRSQWRSVSFSSKTVTQNIQPTSEKLDVPQKTRQCKGSSQTFLILFCKRKKNREKVKGKLCIHF